MFGINKSAVIGLDIGFYSIKILEMVAGKKQPTVRRLVEVPTGFTPNLTEEERQERLVGLLQKAWKDNSIRGKRVDTVISGRSVFYRPLKIPIVTGDRLEKIIRYEAKQQIPFPLDQILLDYHVFGGTSGELEGLLIAVRQDTINDHVRLLSKAGLRVDGVQEASVSLFNATRGLPKEPEEVIGIVNIGASTTDIIIEHDHVLKFRRSAPAAGNELTSALQTNLERSFEECEDLKIRFGHLSSTEESKFDALPAEWSGHVDEFQVVDILDNAFERVVNDVRRSIDFYISQPDGMAVSRLVITGGTTNMPGTVEFLEDRLGIPVEKLNPADSTPVDVSGAITEENASCAMIVCGMAIPPTAEHQVSMSFVPDSIRQRKELEKKRSYIVIQVIFLAMLMTSAFFYLKKDLQYRRNVLNKIEDVININESRIGEELSKVRNQQEEMKNRFTMLRDVADRRGKIINNLLEIVRITPLSHASITSINIEHDRMTIKGEATNDDGMKAYVEELRLSPFVEKMRNVTREGSGNKFVFEVTELHVPNEKENAFYSKARLRRVHLQHLRTFRFGTKRTPNRVIYSFYESIDFEALCDEFTTVLEILVNSEIDYDVIEYRIFNLKEEVVRTFRFDSKEEAMKVYHGEISMLEYIEQFEEAARKRQEEKARQARLKRREGV